MLTNATIDWIETIDQRGGRRWEDDVDFNADTHDAITRQMPHEMRIAVTPDGQLVQV